MTLFQRHYYQCAQEHSMSPVPASMIKSLVSVSKRLHKNELTWADYNTTKTRRAACLFQTVNDRLGSTDCRWSGHLDTEVASSKL